jgi:hypothetical protein
VCKAIIRLLAFLSLNPVLAASAQEIGWVRGIGDAEGHFAAVEIKSTSGGSSAYFGYRCYKQEDKFGLGNGAFFLVIPSKGQACLTNPVFNVTLIVDGKYFPNEFKCDPKKEPNSLFFEYGEESRIQLREMAEIEAAIDKAKRKEIQIAITDTFHQFFIGSLKNASIRKNVYTACNRKP